MSDAFNIGCEAFLRGDDAELNPYCESDAQFDEWEDGFFFEKDRADY